MSWKYGLVKTKLDNGEDWYYLAEIYGEECHSDIDFLGGISGKTPNEVIETLDIIIRDLKKPTIIDEIQKTGENK
jgi:hypothetical protein